MSADYIVDKSTDLADAPAVTPDGAIWVRDAATGVWLPRTDWVAQGALDAHADAEATTRADEDALLIPLAQKGAVNGVAQLDANSKVPNAQLPAIAISDTFVVVSQAALLALTAQVGDVAVRTDISKSFILIADDPTLLANWQELLSPPDSVSSVAGKVGTVVLAEGDITNLVSDLATKEIPSGAQAKVDTHAALAGQDAHSEVVEAKRGGQEFIEANATATGAVTLALANANVFIVTLTGAVVFTFTGATNGRACSFTIVLIQDATGSRLATWPGSVVWPSGVMPTLTMTAGNADVFSFVSVDGGTKWYGFQSGANFA